jgi:hypothetical protein
LCGADHVDRFVFSPFYTQPHFIELSGSGGSAGLQRKLERGELHSLLIDPARSPLDPSLSPIDRKYLIELR